MLTDADIKNLGEIGLEKVISLSCLYKYIGIDDGVKYVLGENTFKFTDPVEFNDPFDCNEKMIYLVVSAEDEKKYILEIGREKGLSRKKTREHFKNIGNRSLQHKVLKEKKKDFKVSCFSEISDDVLMWSHYADKHRGICIGFGLDIMCKEYVLYPVNYIDKMQKIDGRVITGNAFYYWVTFKAERWSYEREVRAVSKTGKSIINFPQAAVKEVIFGCNVKPTVISSVVKSLKKLRYKNIEVSQMVIDYKTMLLKKKPL
ncbi:DUF2971 domain-containing protein [Sphingobacterium sp. SG20118]|uniref:DUF2971 domain-containing protein n=1 Tax=Sphingobacterium sp. SG20118 TaxID=3367156 RepID=UPI0037DFC814